MQQCLTSCVKVFPAGVRRHGSRRRPVHLVPGGAAWPFGAALSPTRRHQLLLHLLSTALSNEECTALDRSVMSLFVTRAFHMSGGARHLTTRAAQPATASKVSRHDDPRQATFLQSLLDMLNKQARQGTCRMSRYLGTEHSKVFRICSIICILPVASE